MLLGEGWDCWCLSGSQLGSSVPFLSQNWLLWSARQFLRTGLGTGSGEMGDMHDFPGCHHQVTGVKSQRCLLT